MGWLIFLYVAFSTSFCLIAMHTIEPPKLNLFKKVVALLLAGPLAWMFFLIAFIVCWLDGDS